MKKKWMIVSVVGLAVVAAVVFSAFQRRPVTVSAITLQPRRVEQTVSCMGVVETADVTVVALPVECVIQQVHVKAGDRVKKGDPLATVDRDATRQTIYDSVSLMALAALPDTITAPCDGTVMEVGAKTQQVLEQGVPCALLAADEDVQIRVAIRERDLRSVRQGMRVRITGDGFEKAAYEGVLTGISSAARTDESGTIVEGVVTLLEGAVDTSLRLGLTARAAIVTSVTENGYVVPYEAVQSDKQGSYVYVWEDGVARRQAIDVAAQVAEGILLQDATLASSQVIRDAQPITANGQRIVLQEESE